MSKLLVRQRLLHIIAHSEGQIGNSFPMFELIKQRECKLELPSRFV